MDDIRTAHDLPAQQELSERALAMVRERRRILAQWPSGGDDPLLSFKEIVADLGCSRATFHRTIRHQLDTARISARRLGVRRSVYDAWKAAQGGQNGNAR